MLFFLTNNQRCEQFAYFCLMKLWCRVFDFYLDASIHVALAVFSLTWITAMTLNIPIDTNLSYFVFFSTIACYDFVKYGVEIQKYVLVANRYHKNMQLIGFIAAGIALYHACFLTFGTWVAIGILLLLTGLYALPVFPKAKNLRSLGGLKIFVVALVWAGTTVILPVVAAQEKIVWDIWVESFQRFILVLVLMVPFEIRDLKYDSPDLRTLPQRYGVTNTKIFGALATVIFFFLTFLKDDVTILETVGKGTLFLILGMLMFVTKRNQKKYFASFWVEAIPIFWLGVMWCLQKWI